MAQVIDYAGLFAPAALPMDQAVAEYASLMRSDLRPWVRRFVCPINWLPEFLENLPAKVEEPWPISVLGTSLDGFRPDMNSMEKFESEAGDRVFIECYEVKANGFELPKAQLGHMANAGFEECFVELSWGDGMGEALHQLVEHEVIGAKARTGGLEVSAFPSGAVLGGFLRECLALELPFKLTAGLHHPMPFADGVLGVTHHGFLNVMLAIALGLSHDLSQSEIEAILANQDKDAFWFTDGGAGFRDYEASLEDLDDARALFLSFGSCSVAEPHHDLMQLGLLEFAR